jgi:hypothetical protein
MHAGTLSRVDAARSLAARLLVDTPDRWQHTIGVAHRAQEVAPTLPPAERDILLVAAWLHDIGSSSMARATGFAPVDGADYLAGRGWPPRITSLVAHHSGADFLARAAGWYVALDRYPEERSELADALTFADQTTGPHGERVTVQARLAESLARHGAGSAYALAHPVCGPYLIATVARVERRLQALSRR